MSTVENQNKDVAIKVNGDLQKYIKTCSDRDMNNNDKKNQYNSWLFLPGKTKSVIKSINVLKIVACFQQG